MRTDILSSLRAVAMFSELGESTLSEIASHCRRRKYPAGSPLFYEQDPGHTLYVIVQGAIVIEKESEGGEGPAVFLAERVPGDVIGEMAIFDNAPRSATALARIDTEVLQLDRDSFLDCVRAEPTVALQIISLLSRRLREAAHQTATRQSKDALARVAAFLLEQVSGDALPSETPRYVPRLTDREVGDRIGAARETVSRKLSRLAQMRLIRLEEKQIVLLDERKLRALGGGNA